MTRRFTRREFLAGITAAGALGACAGPLRRDWGGLHAETEAPEPPSPARAMEMVGRVTRDAALVQFVTSATLPAPIRARVRWAESAKDLDRSTSVSNPVGASRPSAPVELALAGLRPGRHYTYRVEWSFGSDPERWRALSPGGELRTQRTAGESFDFCVIADGHWGHPRLDFDLQTPWGYSGRRCIEQILADGPFDFCIDLGDSAFPVFARALSDVERNYESYRRVIAPLTRVMPVYLVLGNHDREAGFFQRGDGSASAFPSAGLDPEQYHQKWATSARLAFVPNPRSDTYAEGGEGAPGFDSASDWGAGSKPWNDGAATDLQNFYAFTWGDALFVVLDLFRYTLPGQTVIPTAPNQWSLGPTQFRFLEQTLEGSQARWKFVIGHHQAGGGLIDGGGSRIEAGRGVAYGRGSAIEAANADVEQARIQSLMLRTGARFFVYGHDHAFCHSALGEVDYLLCGRPTWINPWYSQDGLLGSYGNLALQGRDRAWVRAAYSVLGYTRFRVSPESVVMEWVRTGYSFLPQAPGVVDPTRFERDWLESWYGQAYPVDSTRLARVPFVPTDVDGVRTPRGATVLRAHQRPPGRDYYVQPDPSRPEVYHDRAVPVGPGFPIAEEPLAVVDYVPEVVYRYEWR